MKLCIATGVETPMGDTSRWARGVTAATLRLERSAERRGGSSPSEPTISQEPFAGKTPGTFSPHLWRPLMMDIGIVMILLDLLWWIRR